MSSFDAYEDEMGRFLRLSDEELARLLSGEAAVGDEAFEEVASLLTEARATFAVAPDAATRARHIAAISEASQLLAENGDPVARPVSKAHGPVGAQGSGLPKWRRVIGMTKTLLLRAAAASLAASLSMVGLAYAGVDLPGTAAEEAIESVLGVELPNQGDDEIEVEVEVEPEVVEGEGPDEEAADVAQEIWNYISTTGDSGCVFGQNVAAIASGSDATPDDDPCTKGDAAGEASTGAEDSAEGRATAEKGQANRGSGDDAADEGQGNNPTGKGADSGDGAADEGQSNNPTGRP